MVLKQKIFVKFQSVHIIQQTVAGLKKSEIFSIS